jgi:hypothetical protein
MKYGYKMFPLNRNSIFVSAWLAVIAVAAALPVAPLAAQERVPVQFAAGNDNAAVEAQVTGQEYRDYVLGARAGQTMAVSLIGDGTIYFNILPPDSDGTAIYNGSIDGNDATGIALPVDGDYTVRVYLMGDDADSNHTVRFTLSMSIL